MTRFQSCNYHTANRWLIPIAGFLIYVSLFPYQVQTVSASETSEYAFLLQVPSCAHGVWALVNTIMHVAHSREHGELEFTKYQAVSNYVLPAVLPAGGVTLECVNIFVHEEKIASVLEKLACGVNGVNTILEFRELFGKEFNQMSAQQIVQIETSLFPLFSACVGGFGAKSLEVKAD